MQSDSMKITNVEVLVLKSPGLYNNPEGSEEPLGPTYMGIVRVSTDAGITGYSDMETAASVAKAAVEAAQAAGIELVLLLSAYGRGGLDRFRQASVSEYLGQVEELRGAGARVGPEHAPDDADALLRSRTRESSIFLDE